MTTTPNKPDFSKQLAEFSAKKAIDKALKPAPAVAKVQQGLVPAPKAAKTSPVKKAGRVVGISADENKFLKELLDLYNNKEMDYNAFIESNKTAYDKLIGRYNK